MVGRKRRYDYEEVLLSSYRTMPDKFKREEDLDCKDAIESALDSLACIVCGDVATGRHYGAIACNGCKGFFRRTIRRGYKYTCRFTANCAIDKHNRAICRFCRYTRCIKAGMRVEQVQNERDVIGKRNRTGTGTGSVGSQSSVKAEPIKRHQSTDSNESKSPDLNSDDPWGHPETLIKALLRSENTIQNLRETVIKQTGTVEYMTTPDEPTTSSSGERTATMHDIFASLHSQLLLVIEWAKTLPPFLTLSTEDQTALLKNFASQHIVLCVAYRSKDTQGFLKLINDSRIPRASNEEAGSGVNSIYLRDCEKVMDQLVAPMAYLNIDDAEFVALKACVLFNPVAKGLSGAAALPVLGIRRRIFSALQYYVQKRNYDVENRIGDLTFFILTPLTSLANSIGEDVLVSKLSGTAKIDNLMEELILADEEQTCQKKAILPLPKSPEMSDNKSPVTYQEFNNLDAQQPRLPMFLCQPGVSVPTCTPSPTVSIDRSLSDPLVDDFDAFSTYPSTTLSSYVLGPIGTSPIDSHAVNGMTHIHQQHHHQQPQNDSHLMWSSPLMNCPASPMYIPNNGY